MAKILIVDDDRGIRQIYSRYLSAEGFDVAEAGDDEEAIREIHRRELDLVLLDLQMPRNESRELVPALRETHPNAKLIISSCHDLEFQQKKAATADDYFNKSEGCLALVSKIRQVLSL
jgi:DNA-binding response OmpR family regulator